MTRENGKSQSIYRELRSRITTGKLAVGWRLPKEIEFCHEFGVARETLRHALAMLEEENLITRKRSLGTFVAEPPAKPSVINFLLPCPNFLSRRGVVSVFNRLLFEGVLTECYQHNCRVSTVAVSTDNDNRHIDMRQLQFLEPDSRIVVQSTWFEPVFPLLESLHCRIAYIGGRTVPRSLEDGLVHPQPPASAKKFFFDDRGAIELATAQLFQAGCRRVALCAPFYVNDLCSPPRNGYLEAIARAGQPTPLIFPLPDAAPPWPWMAERLAKYHQDLDFDGLVLCPRDADVPDSGLYSNAALGLPPSVKVMLSWLMPERSYHESRFPYVIFDAKAIGRTAAQSLLEDHFVADETVIPPFFHQAPPCNDSDS